MADKEMVLLDTTPEGVATVTLNRPDLHNAMNDEMIERLGDIFDDLGKQDGVRLVLLQGAGKSFSAGADLNWMRRAADFTEEENYEDAAALGHMLRALHQMPKPTVALLHGSAYAGGIGLLAACDIAVAVRDIQFSLTEVRLGLIPAVISPYVIAAIGARNARRYILTAERFNAVEAHRIGLVHELVADHAGLMAARDRLIRDFTAAAPGAVAAAKALIGDVAGQPIDSALILDTARRIADRRASDEGKEGLQAFLDKRKPNWVEGG